ncbi:hypothetical protein ACJMK2_012870 [Sinanodonta woodiana]|uniref:Right handed beta helix domain-containing protein n=1 Tax=Sinanodonta woodiana TaxID=1069815 RepID=A0ABD3V9L2_SINWO
MMEFGENKFRGGGCERAGLDDPLPTSISETGGKRIPSNLFKNVTDANILHRLAPQARQHVKVIHLPDAGITNYGKINEYGFYITRAAPLEIFWNGEPTRLARYPNQGFLNIDHVLDGQTGKRFTFADRHLLNWTHENEIWTYGYWYWSWADRSVKVAHIDTSNRTLTLDKNPQYGLRIGHYANNGPGPGFSYQGGYFRFFNVLGELDEPGEYYLDRTTGNLYIWPPGRQHLSDSNVVYASLLDDCVVLRNASNIVFKDFTLEACRRSGFVATLIHDVTFESLEVRNTGAYAIDVNGRDVTVAKCDIHDSDGGIRIVGGIRSTLESSGHVVDDNKIWKFSREGAVGNNAVEMAGVGTLVRHNDMFEGQYDAIHWSGNDHVIEYNHIHHTCMNSSDCGALMCGRDWTARGVVIRYNYIHHTLRHVPGAANRGIMLDDQYSSVIIEYNVFYDNMVHVNIGGGRDNIVRYNIFYNATAYAMQIDSRGINHVFDKDLLPRLKAVPYTNQLWQSKYPELAIIDSMHKEFPEGNQIHHNVVYQGNNRDVIHLYTGSLSNASWFNVSSIWIATDKSEFVDPSKLDFSVRCSAADWANAENFPQPLKLNEIGPRFPTGPAYKHGPQTTKPTAIAAHQNNAPCTTRAPSPEPQHSYLPDGSHPNTLYNVSKQGCWLVIDSCHNYPNMTGKMRDTYGEAHEMAGTDESHCLARAAKQWKTCGSTPNHPVTAIYGPTGAMTVGGDGCFVADYGCPAHGSSNSGRIYRDTNAEQQLNASTNEEACLSRAYSLWLDCGSNDKYPVTSIFRPTGRIRTAGGGCWIHVPHCPAHTEVKTMFFDASGAARIHSDAWIFTCLSQAEYYWKYCGSHREYPVTAYYRPSAMSTTFPFHSAHINAKGGWL